MTHQRYKGLTGQQRFNCLLALRDDTIITGKRKYPVQPKHVDNPSSDEDIQWWHDVSQGKASFDVQGDNITYDQYKGAVVFEKSNDEEALLTPNVGTQPNKDYFSQMYESSFSLGVVFEHLDSSNISGYEGIFGTTDGTGGGFGIGVNDDSGTPYFGAEMRDGSGSIVWSTGVTNVDLSGVTKAWIHQDVPNGNVRVYANDNLIYENTSASFSPTTGVVAGEIGRKPGTTSGHIHMALRGILIELNDPEHGQEAVDWIEGSNYTGY